MKKIWILYIIFVIFFLFGDIASTYLATGVKSSAIASKVELPEQCICTYPPECDMSPIMKNADSVINWKIILPKLIFALFPLVLIYSKIYIAMVLLDIYFILFTFSNIATVFFPYAYFIILAGALLNLFLLYYFLEEKKWTITNQCIMERKVRAGKIFIEKYFINGL